jgi:glycosyltransferase involved in cell wall biosynthesis
MSGDTENTRTLSIAIDARSANSVSRVGIGTYCFEVLSALIRIEKPLFLHIYLDSPPLHDFPNPASRGKIHVIPKRRAWTHRSLGPALTRDKPDVFFAPGVQVPWRCPCPTVVSALDIAYRTFPEYFPLRFRLSARIQAAYAFRWANHCIAISGATKADVCHAYHCQPERVTVCLLGVSPRFHPERDDVKLKTVREKYNLPHRFLLYVGAIQPRKNLPRLVEAYSALCSSRPEFGHDLVIAGGGGWLEETTRHAIESATVRNRIHRTGYVDNDDLPSLMTLADAVALVSLWEGFGLPALEAMACGTPVLASNCSSLPEVVGDSGILIDPNDTADIARGMEKMLMDDSLRQRLGEAALIRSSAFTWENTAQTVYSVLRRVALEAN